MTLTDHLSHCRSRHSVLHGVLEAQTPSQTRQILRVQRPVRTEARSGGRDLRGRGGARESQPEALRAAAERGRGRERDPKRAREHPRRGESQQESEDQQQQPGQLHHRGADGPGSGRG